MPSTALTAIIVVSVLASVLTVYRLWRAELFLKYRLFCLYFVCRTPYLAAPLFVSLNSSTYLYLWLAFQPLMWGFRVAVVVELYRLILGRYRGLYTLGRWTMYVSTIAAIALSILSLLPKFTPSMPQVSRLLGYFYAVDRGVDFSLVVFIFLILIFLSLYPVPVSRNAVVHISLFTVYFLSSTMALLLKSITGTVLSDQINLILSGATAVCTTGWLFLLTPKGERLPVRNPVIGPEHEQRVLRHLETLNATLLRAARS
jgi:hypothetical protein